MGSTSVVTEGRLWDLSSHRFWYSHGSWNQSPMDMEDWLYTSIILWMNKLRIREVRACPKTQGQGSPVLSNFFFFSFFFLKKIFFYFLYCSGFCHTLKWNSHGSTCVPHPDPPSHLPLHPIPLGLPSAPGPSACLMHPTWAGDLFHPR